MKFSKMTMLLLAGSLVALPLSASAQHGEHGKGKCADKMFADLNLTADQKTKLKELHTTHRDAHKQLFDQMKALRDKTKEELLKTTPAKPVLDQFAAQMGDLHKQLAEKRTGHLLQVKSVLTPEQFSKLLSREPRAHCKKGGMGCKHMKQGCSGPGEGM